MMNGIRNIALMKFKIIILLLVVFAFACKKEKGTATPAQGVLTTGTWYVSKLMEDGIDVTNLFDEYTFVFNTNGELTAACPYGTEVGSWYAEEDDDGEDEFRIALGNTEPLRHLSKRWHIRSQVSDKVEFYDDDNNGEELTFTKQ
jgi:hypothetical protein